MSIYDYTNYRLFLHDLLKEKRAKKSHLTYDELGKQVGFSSRGFVTQILQGKSKIPQKLIEKFALALGLKKKEREYFTLLVKFNQAKSHAQRNKFYQMIIARFRTRIATLDPEKFDFYNKWYISAVRSLLGYYPFNGDYEKLAKQLNPAITPGQARKAIRLLRRLGLIEKKDDGYYHLKDRMITTGGSVQSVAVTNFQQETMELAKEALSRFPRNQRNSSTLTLGLSDEGYRAVEEKLAGLRKDLFEIAKFDKDINRVVQVNLHAFPMTRIQKDKKA
jgi:uncharacterized protein (TIGR02147 family)